MPSARAARRAFLGVAALVFATSAAATIIRSESMSAMGEMSMPGGWTISMMWMRMPGQTWHGVAASFVGMWVVMMVAMMLPSLAPMLWRYHEAIRRTRRTRLGQLTALVGVAYFLVWTVLGMAVFTLGVALAAIEMQWPALARATPIAVSVAVLIAGCLQLTSWKARYLALCREPVAHHKTLAADAGTAWRHGLCLGLHCSYSCAPLTTIVLVIGVMDLRVMAVVTAVITLERLAPADVRVSRVIGAVVIGAGLSMMVLTAGRISYPSVRTSSALSIRHAPFARSPRTSGPIATRTNRSTSTPTSVKIRRSWRFFPSSSVTSNQAPLRDPMRKQRDGLHLEPLARRLLDDTGPTRSSAASNAAPRTWM